jgi:hypothetical protein
MDAPSTPSIRTRRFARRSAVSSLLLGMAGQVAYYLLAQAHVTHAPWGITTAVSCLPVLVLGMAPPWPTFSARTRRTRLGLVRTRRRTTRTTAERAGTMLPD